MYRWKDIWGEDADEFWPDRWAGRRPGWELFPFNGGLRIFLKQQFALTKAGYVVRMLQRFDKVENMEKSTVVKYESIATTALVEVLMCLHTYQ